MAVLIISDQAGIACASWVFREILRHVTDILYRDGHNELGEWFESEEFGVTIFHSLDVRELTPANQSAFISSTIPAYELAQARGPVGWKQPDHGQWTIEEVWNNFMTMFGKLAAQIEDLNNGLKPHSVTNLSGIDEHKGSKVGPGWGW